MANFKCGGGAFGGPLTLGGTNCALRAGGKVLAGVADGSDATGAPDAAGVGAIGACCAMSS